jgi:hypothetical protein
MNESEESGSEESDDQQFSVQLDPNIVYDNIIKTHYPQLTLPQGREALSLVDGKHEKAKDLVQKTVDLQQYLEDLGAIRSPNIDMSALFRFCANRVLYSQFVHSRLIGMLPHNLIQEYDMEFVKTSDEYPLCAQDAQINAVCSGSPNPVSCYENALGFTEQRRTDSSVTLSKQLMRFLCKNVNNTILKAQREAIETIDSVINDHWTRFQKVRGADKLDHIEIKVLTLPVALYPEMSVRIFKEDHIQMLKDSFSLSYKKANYETTSQAFKEYVKRRFQREIIKQTPRRIEDAVMKNNKLYYNILAKSSNQSVSAISYSGENI